MKMSRLQLSDVPPPSASSRGVEGRGKAHTARNKVAACVLPWRHSMLHYSPSEKLRAMLPTMIAYHETMTFILVPRVSVSFVNHGKRGSGDEDG